MLLLAIDTSTTAITTALHDGSTVVAEVTTLDARAHAEHLAPGIQRALGDAGAEPGDLTDVVVGIGPGPFTGLRVGIVTGRTLAFALDLPVRGLTSLDALAHQAWLGGRRGDLLVATDARRKEVYAATYVLGERGATRTAGPLVSRAADLQARWRELPCVGRGPTVYPDDLPHAADLRDGPVLDVSAGALADLAVRRLTGSGSAGPVAASAPTSPPPPPPPPAAPDGIRQHVGAAGGFDGLEPLYLRRPDAAPAPPSRKSTLG